MSVQTKFSSIGEPLKKPQSTNLPDPPDDDELEELIAPNWMFPFDVEQVDGIHELRKRIRDATYADNPIKEWSYIIGDHVSYGNKKIADHVGIFNVGSAHDCPNLGTRQCQVDEADCYAVRSEDNFPSSLPYRRRQAVIWEYIDAVSWARAFREHYERKRTDVTALRFNESGDVRHRHDILKMDEIARRLSDVVDTYTYSASADLDWEEVNHFVVNQSNDHRNFGARRFEVVDDVDQIPTGGLRCPHDRSDGDISCGDCRLCVDRDAPDVYVKNFY
jgi:hypothetical protein